MPMPVIAATIWSSPSAPEKSAFESDCARRSASGRTQRAQLLPHRCQHRDAPIVCGHAPPRTPVAPMRSTTASSSEGSASSADGGAPSRRAPRRGSPPAPPAVASGSRSTTGRRTRPCRPARGRRSAPPSRRSRRVRNCSVKMSPTRSARSYIKAGICTARSRRARRVAEQHREAVGPLLDVGEERERGLLEALARRPGGDRLDDARDDVLHLAVDDDRVEPFLAAEVLVHDGLRDLGARRDLLDRRRLVAALGEHRASDLDQLCPAGRGRQPPRASSVRFATLTRYYAYRNLRNRKLRSRRKPEDPMEYAARAPREPRPGPCGATLWAGRPFRLAAARLALPRARESAAGRRTRSRRAWKRCATRRATRAR